MQKSVREAGCSLKREEYVLGFSVTLLTTHRLILGHKWFVRDAAGLKVCEGVNPGQCYKRFLGATAEQPWARLKVLTKQKQSKNCIKILPK